VLDQHALDLKRPDAVVAGFDNVVVAAHKPEVAVGIAVGLVAGVVEAVAKHAGRPLGLAKIAGKQAVGPARIGAHRNVALG
jgi:hypothetical protein